ncbi:hypothetical protein PCL1606_32940 [Pseudomonas chlororaphis]|uniref:Uncharacterized protein n=1 Tax=Pseudomonas chlororaphis TaxID=587753 RepID=A0A0D5Y0C5_9PSED|nr:hypothetical protein PCL1606_32940 [Pseudomonas chlororaphis]
MGFGPGVGELRVHGRASWPWRCTYPLLKQGDLPVDLDSTVIPVAAAEPRRGCDRLRSRRKTLHLDLPDTPSRPPWRPLRARSQPRCARQRLRKARVTQPSPPFIA